MPVLQPFPVFQKKAQDLYKTLTDSITNEVSQHEISHTNTPADLEVIKSKVLRQLWKWPKIEIFDNTSLKDYNEIELSQHEASSVFSSYSFSSNRNTISVLLITYGLTYKGDIKALAYTVQYAPRVIRIANIADGNLTFYFYCQGTIENCASPAKAEKNNIIHILNTNQGEINDFFDQKKNQFELLIGEKINSVFNAAVDKNRGLSLL